MSVPADVRAYVAEHDLTARSPLRATGRTIAVVALYAALTAVGFALDSWAAWLLVWFAQACVLAGSYSAMHEAGHANLFRSRRANRVAGIMWSSTILVNWSLWRSFHLEHHAHAGQPDDPEAAYKIDIVRRSQYLLLPLGGLQYIIQLWVHSLGTLFGRYPSYVRTRVGRRAMQVDAVVLLLVTAGLASAAVAAPGVLLRVWGGALILTFGVTMPGTALNEHYGCASEGEAFDTARTVVSNRLFRFIYWNNNYHVEHHLMPAVSYQHAPTLHRYIEPRIKHLAPSFTAFHLGVLRDCGTKRVAPAAEISGR